MSTEDKVEDVGGVLGVVLVLPSLPFFSSNLPSSPFSL
jgi:hypothetical protein